MKKSHFEKNVFKVLTSTAYSWKCARTFTYFMVLEFEFFFNILGEDFWRSKELKNAKKIDFFKILKCTSDSNWSTMKLKVWYVWILTFCIGICFYCVRCEATLLFLSILWIIEMLFYSKNNKANFQIQTSNFILNDPIINLPRNTEEKKRRNK